MILTLRRRVFISFLLALVPVFLLLAGAIEMFLVGHIEERVLDELSNTTELLSKAVETSASVSIRNHLKAIAERNLEIARYHFELVDQGLLTRDEAEERLRQILLSQRVGTSGYIVCLTSKGIIDLHPVPEYEGMDNTRFAFAREQMARKEGYMEYEWRNPEDPAPRSKALYMVYFEPLDWIISVSSYRSEFDELLNPDDFRDTVLAVQIGDTGYASVTDDDGNMLVHPYWDEFNLHQQSDIPPETVESILSSESGSIEYLWRNPTDPAPHRKLAVHRRIPHLNWVVISSVEYSEVMRPARIMRGVCYGAIALLLLTAGTAAYLLSGKLTRPISAMIGQLDRNARSGVHAPLPVHRDDEVGRLALEFNNYMARVDEQSAILQRERERYRSLFDTCPDAILLMQGRSLIDCNPAACTMFMGPSEQVLGRPFTELLPPVQERGERSADVLGDALENLAASGYRSMELTCRAFDGRCFLCEIRFAYFGEEAGEPLSVAFARDITERRRAEDALRAERDFSKALIDASPAYIVILDGDGRVQQMNPALEEVLGLEPGRARGTDFLAFALTERDSEIMRAAIEVALAQSSHGDAKEEPSGPSVVVTQDHDGPATQWSITRLLNPSGGGYSVLAVGLDISEERRLHDQLHHAQKFEALGRLAGGVAHDFNNMLGGIMGATELLGLELPPDSPLQTDVKLIMETVDRAAELAGRLLSFSRKGKGVSTPVDLHEMLRNSFRIFKSGLDPRIETSISLEADLPKVIGDPTQLQNVFLNLFINARDAISERGTLAVSTCAIELTDAECATSSFDLEPGHYIEVSVTDTGEGMDGETLARIFEPFFTTKSEGRGTGLGLAAVYGTIKNHRGEIVAGSTRGEGTTFSVRLPVTEAEIVPAAAKAAIVRGEGTVLLVDDDEVLRTTGRMMLEELGYQAIVASDGEEGVAMYRERRAEIDLVILDMVMPRMNGRDAFRLIRSESEDARVILASGFSERETVQSLEREGLLGFVHKPYRLAELSSAIARAMGIPHGAGSQPMD